MGEPTKAPSDRTSFTCARCGEVYEGVACPKCRLLARPRCRECSSRLYFDVANKQCPGCGRMLTEDDFVKA